MITNKNKWLVALVGIIGLSASALAVPVTPGGTATGNSNNCIPFACNRPYQQVFNGDSFGGVSGIVKSVAFRLDEENFTQTISGATGNFEVHLSHTNATATTISPTFANNRGADDTIVMQGTRVYSATQTPGFGDNPFDFVLDFDDIFFYNGTGNLLLEIFVISPLSVDIVLDARDNTNYTGRAIGSQVSFPGYGLVAQFDIAPRIVVPEPVSLALFGLGLSLFGLRRRLC